MAILSCTFAAAGSLCFARVSRRLGVAHGTFLALGGVIEAIHQANESRCKGERAGNDDGIIKNINKHDVSSFSLIFSMVTLYAFIGGLYIDKNAKTGAYILCDFVCML